MDNVRPTDIVISLAGHDRGRLFTVVSAKDGFAFLADGRTRRSSDPKKKSVKHLKLFKSQPPELADAFNRGNATDSVIRKELAIFRCEIGITEEGSQSCQKTM